MTKEQKKSTRNLKLGNLAIALTAVGTLLTQLDINSWPLLLEKVIYNPINLLALAGLIVAALRGQSK